MTIRWAALLLACAATLAHAADEVPVARFSGQSPGGTPAGWVPIVFSKRVPPADFLLAEDAGTTVLKAQADHKASGLAFAARFDPAATPHLRWKWKVDRPVTGGDPTTRGGDDYPLRIYVTFDYDPSHLPFLERAKLTLAKALYGDQVPSAAICYVWDGRLPAGKSFPNPFTASVRMIVVRGAPAEPGRWTEEHRDIAKDFRDAFGEDAPMVTGIIVGADTDNTGDHSLGWLGDIRVTAR